MSNEKSRRRESGCVVSAAARLSILKTSAPMELRPDGGPGYRGNSGDCELLDKSDTHYLLIGYGVRKHAKAILEKIVA
jgi:hypothetical protein